MLSARNPRLCPGAFRQGTARRRPVSPRFGCARCGWARRGPASPGGSRHLRSWLGFPSWGAARLVPALRVQASLGVAWPVWSRPGLVWRVEAGRGRSRRGFPWYGTAPHGRVWQVAVSACLGASRPGLSGRGGARLGFPYLGQARQGCPVRGLAGPGEVRPGEAGQGQSWRVPAGLLYTGEAGLRTRLPFFV